MNLPPLLLAALRSAQRVTVLTGAGVSADSGLATFRDKQIGLWERFDPVQLATLAAYERDPELVWGWYEWRRMQIMRAAPNPGHLAIAELRHRVPSLTLITQNVDDLHERAGSDSVHHLHGRIFQPYCMRCSEHYQLPTEIPNEPVEGRPLRPPRCVRCEGMIRPGVVWFGESLPQKEWQIAVHAARECDLFFCIGTSSTVFPAASLLPTAAENGAVTVQVNAANMADDGVTFNLCAPSGALLPELARQAWG